MYILANLKLRYGQSAVFATHMAVIKTHMERRGWTMIGAYQAIIGDFTHVTHIWKVEGGDQVVSSMIDAGGDPEVIAAMAGLAEVAVEETTQLCVAMPYLEPAP